MAARCYVAVVVYGSRRPADQVTALARRELPAEAEEIHWLRVQIKARWAWDDWEEDDIEDELRAWRELSR
jgi:hypothetical protein